MAQLLEEKLELMKALVQAMAVMVVRMIKQVKD